MVHDQHAAADSIAAHLMARTTAVDVHDGDGGVQIVVEVIRTARHRYHHAIDLELEEQPHSVAFGSLNTAGVIDQYAQVVLGRLILNTLAEIGEEGVSHVRNDQTDKPAAPG